jgi:hypothetical protein
MVTFQPHERGVRTSDVEPRQELARRRDDPIAFRDDDDGEIRTSVQADRLPERLDALGARARAQARAEAQARARPLARRPSALGARCVRDGGVEARRAQLLSQALVAGTTGIGAGSDDPQVPRPRRCRCIHAVIVTAGCDINARSLVVHPLWLVSQEDRGGVVVIGLTRGVTGFVPYR